MAELLHGKEKKMTDSKLFQAIDMMIRTNRMHKSLIDHRVRDIGIHRTQHRILMKLARCENVPSQKELADHLDITPAAVTGALKKIEADGYIERRLGQDTRYNELQITDKGRELVTRSREMFSEIDRSLFDGFTDEELDTYIMCLEKLQGNVRRQLTGCEEEKLQK